jgi:hypothetical protein
MGKIRIPNNLDTQREPLFNINSPTLFYRMAVLKVYSLGPWESLRPFHEAGPIPYLCELNSLPVHQPKQYITTGSVQKQI